MQESFSNISDKLLQTFETISLEEMDSIKLLNRTDTKFVFNIKLLPEILSLAKEHYKILEINNIRNSEYKSIYFDTPDNRLFLDHQNGRLNRYKIRQREYINTNDYYLEIKYKTNKNRTIKYRKSIDKLEYDLSEKSKAFINKRFSYKADDLVFTLLNRFKRITLANTDAKERITIDTNLKYVKDTLDYELPFLVVAEIKQEGYSNSSVFNKILKDQKIQPSGMSKFCIGLLNFNKDIKYNNFKTRLLKINKIKNEEFIS